ncbi:MAG TPA: crosslink repair DNA glycosylase YcaQ family protein [Candidatus Limnocylindrales bacterium]|nr:crosslink repair DNA glycosylase YcaQ family protein [Candidatus Limnocylindrales bacterium]
MGADDSPPHPRTISREVARRFLAVRHFLGPPRSLPPDPASVMTVVERIGSLQFDPLEVAGRNHDLVLLSRIACYRREWTDALLYEHRTLFEAYNKGLSLLPTSELPWYRSVWDRVQARHAEGVFISHAGLVDELVERIRTNGPLAATDVEPRNAIDWYWRPTNEVRAVLEALAESGVLGLARRDGNRRVYDLAERLFPAELLDDRSRNPREQAAHRLLSRYRAHGLLGRGGGQAELWGGLGPATPPPGDPRPGRAELREELEASSALVAVSIEGVKRQRLMVAGELALLEAAEREVAAGVGPGGREPGVAFLAPLDPLVWDRAFLRECYDFDYIWEVYVPAAKRRWGYYVLPILYGDRFVGRIEPRIDRRADTLRILGAWWEAGFDPLADEVFIDALAAAIDAHRAFGGVRRVAWPRTARLRAVGAQVRRRLG